jgi:hypothetical protein
MTRWNRREVSDRIESHEGLDCALVSGTRSVPMLLTVDDVADLLRTARRAVYAMIERRQLPGIVRISRPRPGPRRRTATLARSEVAGVAEE